MYNDEEVQAAQRDPLLESKLAVRRWDDQAKDPTMRTPPLSAFEEMAVRSLLKSKKALFSRSRDSCTSLGSSHKLRPNLCHRGGQWS